MRRLLVLLLFIAASFAPAAAGEEDRTHTGHSKTEHFDILVRPGSRAAASAESWSSLAERLYDRIAGQLEYEPPKRLRIFLYDSVEEMVAITGVKAGGYSVPLVSHFPYDNEQTAYHELVHVFAEQLPKTGEEKRDCFHIEGLANALLVYVDGVHVHAVARYYLDAKRLPTLKELSTGKGLFGWTATHPRMRGYDIGGSFMRHLIDTYGVSRVKRYYTGTAAKEAFGVEEAALEKGWHATLNTYRLGPEVMTLLRKGEGKDATFTHYEKDPEKRLPADLLGKAEDWKVLTAGRLRPAKSTFWTRKGKVVAGSEPGGKQWRTCEFGTANYTDCVAIVRLSIPTFCPAVQLRLGDECQAMFVSNGTFLYRGTQGIKGNPKLGNPGRGDVHLALVRRGHEIRIFVNGEQALLIPNGDATPARVGVGFLGGSIRVHEVKVRRLTR